MHFSVINQIIPHFFPEKETPVGKTVDIEVSTPAGIDKEPLPVTFTISDKAQTVIVFCQKRRYGLILKGDFFF